ncbi:hypothetical protein SAMN05421593_1635 [Chryseobacterium culicis]|uniref:Uncharacterized protein n=1 Tax=Chryseobacterium culicis TaxID=680127 RepID=A0A1H6HD02_CHRCI|nr:hypothetical protein SAMN05421593_1635 [Chryseobacterium culicis]
MGRNLLQIVTEVFTLNKKAAPFGAASYLKRFNYFTFTSSTSKTNHEFGGITPPAPLSP